MIRDWTSFLRVYDRCIGFGVLNDDDLDAVTAATKFLQPESLAILLLRRMEAHMTDLARTGGAE